jgi:hypothetical protein
MTKKEVFYQKIIHQIPVYLSGGQMINFKSDEVKSGAPERITGFNVYNSKDSYCFGANKPISKLIENEYAIKVL